MEKTKIFRWSLALLISNAIAALMLFIGFKQNIQQEFYSDETGVDILYSLMLYFSWQIGILVFCILLYIVFRKLESAFNGN